MLLTDAQVHYLRTKVGTDAPTDDELQEAFDRLDDVDSVAREALEIRLADLLAAPESFSVSGEYSQSTGRNIDGIKATLATLGGISELGSGGTVRIIEPSPSFSRKAFPDAGR